MAEFTTQIITLAPRVPKGRDAVTVFITKEISVRITETLEKTVSVLDTSFIHVTTTITATSTTINPTTITKTLTPVPVASTTTQKETIPCTLPPAHAPVAKHVDPFQVLSIVLGVFILFLIALMWFLVRRFYKMYRAERVLRKQLQTEGTEMPRVGMSMGAVEAETHVIGEE